MGRKVRVQVQYDESDEIFPVEVTLEDDGSIKHRSFLSKTDLIYAVNARTGKIVEGDEQGNARIADFEHLCVRGAKFQREYKKLAWLKLPSGSGKVFQEAQYEYLTSTSCDKFPEVVYHFPGLKEAVQSFAAGLDDSDEASYGPNPNDARPIASSEEEIRAEAKVHTFKPVSDVLEREAAGLGWHETMKKGVKGRQSLDQETSDADWHLGQPGARDVIGSGEGKAAWILFKGWTAIDRWARDAPRLQRNLQIWAEDQPINLVERFNHPNFGKNDPVKKAIGQAWGYAFDGSGTLVRSVVPLSCDAALWLLFPHPANPKILGISDPILLTDLAPTQKMALYFASRILLDENLLPGMPPLDAVQATTVHQQGPLAQSRGPRSDTDSTSSSSTGVYRRMSSRLSQTKGVHQAARTLQPRIVPEQLLNSPDREALVLKYFLQDGHAGPVYEGRYGSARVVVKTARMGKTLKGLAILSHEIKVLQALQGCLDCPKVLAYGYYDSVYALALEWIPGRDMEPSDARHLPAALHSLRALHALGYKHGDLRLENMRVNKAGKVFLLDFGASKLCFDKGKCKEEEQQLRGLFCISRDLD